MTGPQVHEIPGLEKVLRDYEDNISSMTDVGRFIGDLWKADAPMLIAAPKGLRLSIANEICSCVLAYREICRQAQQPVEIKQVAEIRGSRFNTGKLRMDLIDQLAMEGLAAVLTKGAVKYNAHNWRAGLPYTETVASMLRHVAKFMQGEDIDPETGLPHVDHIQCNAMFLSNMTKTRPDMDDRWTPLATPPEQVAAAYAAERKSS